MYYTDFKIKKSDKIDFKPKLNRRDGGILHAHQRKKNPPTSMHKTQGTQVHKRNNTIV